MSAERDELRELVGRLPEGQVPAVLAEARRHLEAVSERPWPPAFFGAGRASRSDIAARSEELLGEDFRRAAKLVETYADLPLGTTDVTVIAVAERLGVTEVATLDRRHFNVVRPQQTAVLTLLP